MAKKKPQFWEYEFRSVHGLQYATNFANNMGAEGWELVSMVVRRIDKEKGMFTLGFKRATEKPRVRVRHTETEIAGDA